MSCRKLFVFKRKDKLGQRFGTRIVRFFYYFASRRFPGGGSVN
jgi:hypothetical protein